MSSETMTNWDNVDQELNKTFPKAGIVYPIDMKAQIAYDTIKQQYRVTLQDRRYLFLWRSQLSIINVIRRKNPADVLNIIFEREPDGRMIPRLNE